MVFPGRILISFVFSDLSRAPAPLCDHGLYRFFTWVNVRKKQKKNKLVYYQPKETRNHSSVLLLSS